MVKSLVETGVLSSFGDQVFDLSVVEVYHCELALVLLLLASLELILASRVVVEDTSSCCGPSPHLALCLSNGKTPILRPTFGCIQVSGEKFSRDTG
jgi:hypothetical protein